MRKGNRKFPVNCILIIIVRIICRHILVEMCQWKITDRIISTNDYESFLFLILLVSSLIVWMDHGKHLSWWAAVLHASTVRCELLLFVRVLSSCTSVHMCDEKLWHQPRLSIWIFAMHQHERRNPQTPKQAMTNPWQLEQNNISSFPIQIRNAWAHSRQTKTVIKEGNRISSNQHVPRKCQGVFNHCQVAPRGDLFPH